jgi:SagB-type dehydrogenase family enzyme
MKNKSLISWMLNIALLFAVVIVLFINTGSKRSNMEEMTTLPEGPDPELLMEDPMTYQLPGPRLESDFSVEQAMAKRRSHRNYVKSAISSAELSQVLWAAYGITKVDQSRAVFRGGFRTAPSAGATYPLEIYAVVGKVKGLEAGIYRYIPDGHRLVLEHEGDFREELARAALNQEMIADAPVSLFYSAVFDRTMQRYGERGRLRYVPMDLGHSAQNVYLQAEALGLGTCAIGAFNDTRVTEVMKLPGEEEALYIMPVGRYYRD